MGDQALVIIPPAGSALQAFRAPALAALSDAEILSAAASPATRRAYQSDALIFANWCGAEGLADLPAEPQTIARFLLAQARGGIKPSTLTRRVAAIRAYHKHAGHEPPTSAEIVRTTMKGIRRSVGAKRTKKSAATADIVRLMLDAAEDTLAGKRDRALLALGFAGAFRRSELVALEVDDLVEVPDGFLLTIRRSKTDQEGEGQTIHIPRGAKLRPVEALNAWLDAAAITEGPVFRRVRPCGRIGTEPLAGATVAKIVKRYCLLAGQDPTRFSGHSLRSGFLTSAADHGASIFKMMAVSRHKSVDTLQGYVRAADGFKDHAGSAFL